MSMLRRKIGGLSLMAKLGQGGMSEVYLGLNTRTREQRAVKIVAKQASKLASAYARFLREIEIIRKLSHPRIVRIYESGELEDCYFYVMDFIEGGSLAQHLANGRLPLGESLGILEDICQAMCHAHGAGVIHRDLKPGNILLDRNGAAFISDFGIAKTLVSQATDLTRSNEVMGTMAYLAPEQRINARSVDRRADVFAIGAIF
jgi:serine/threonine-protein kinase